MGLDIQLFRKDQGGDPQLVIESQKRRFAKESAVDDVIAADEECKQAKHAQNQANKAIRDVEQEIKKLRMAKQEVPAELMTKKKDAEAHAVVCDKAAEQKALDLERIMGPIGNLVHESVPVSNNEDNNAIVHQWGKFESTPNHKHHHELLYMIDGYDPERGVKVAGHRGYFLKGVGVQLNYAVQSYGMDFLRRRKYTLLQPPYFMKKDAMSKTAQLEQFDEELYKIVGGAQDEETEKYMIATSEQPISALHQGEWMETKDLPIRYAGISTCFRKEAGAHGKDTWGIFRVHQFEKVEQFCLTTPDKSWEMHEEMINSSKDFYESLGIPYRVVSIVSGALNNAAAKKYDLEGFFPGFNEFRELVSASNCTDYQSRSLNIRCGSKKQDEKEKKYVHMLNSTLCATTRTICAILENYQTETGVRVPDVLKPYMDGREFIEFVHAEMPKKKGQKGQKEAPKGAAIKDTKDVAPEGGKKEEKEEKK